MYPYSCQFFFAVFAATALFLASPAAFAGSRAADAVRYSQQNFAEFLDLLGIENVPDEPRNMQRNADFLEDSLRRRGFTIERIDNAAGRPLLVAELPASRRAAVTMLFYMHFDGQPVLPEDWSQPDPFEPVVKRRDEQGKWQVVGRERLMTKPLDPELRVFARSASDDKAPIMMLLTALDMLKAESKLPSVHVRVLLDPEEEISSPHLAASVKSRHSLFAADALVVLDGPVHGSGKPTIVFGNRGITQATLKVFGPRSPLHSGHYGNYIPNPAQRLAALLASMKGDDGRVTIDGYYDGVELTTTDRASLASADDDETALLKRTGVARAERVGESYQESLQYPSLNVRGMASAGVGPKAANIVPSEAVAELDLRTTPETDGRRLYALIRRHIEKRGYHLVDEAPTDEERVRYDKLASFSTRLGAGRPTDADGLRGRTLGVSGAEVRERPSARR